MCEPCSLVRIAKSSKESELGAGQASFSYPRVAHTVHPMYSRLEKSIDAPSRAATSNSRSVGSMCVARVDVACVLRTAHPSHIDCRDIMHSLRHYTLHTATRRV
jgi:hypothetical protein